MNLLVYKFPGILKYLAASVTRSNNNCGTGESPMVMPIMMTNVEALYPNHTCEPFCMNTIYVSCLIWFSDGQKPKLAWHKKPEKSYIDGYTIRNHN